LKGSADGEAADDALARADACSPDAAPLSGGGERTACRNPLRRLYHWVLRWAESPYGEPALFVLAVVEACFFPVPPDVLLIALALGARNKALRFAAVCVLGSVTGGCISYAVGRLLFDPVASPVMDFVGLRQAYEVAKANIQSYGLLYVFVAALTPIPYCVFTTAAGASHVPFAVLVAASALGRSLRFGVEALLIRQFGGPIKRFIERYFNLLTIAFAVLLAAAVLVAKMVAREREAGPAGDAPAGMEEEARGGDATPIAPAR